MIKETKNNIVGSDFWLNSEDLSFSEITAMSRVPDRWRRFDVIESEYSNTLLRPINRYVSNLYPRPEAILLSPETGLVTLRQKTHAEIWVKPIENDLYALDKTWQRQFYPSANRYEKDGCFAATYKFYMPWLLDEDVHATISEVQDSPFFVERQVVHFTKLDNLVVIDTHFVDFKIKNGGSHMVDDRYGIIGIGTPMYDIHLKLQGDQVERLVEQYG